MFTFRMARSLSALVSSHSASVDAVPERDRPAQLFRTPQERDHPALGRIARLTTLRQ